VIEDTFDLRLGGWWGKKFSKKIGKGAWGDANGFELRKMSAFYETCRRVRRLGRFGIAAKGANRRWI
jgi:hypothetical protein